MKCVSLVAWLDLESGHSYKPGDEYPFDGRTTEERISELSSSQNKVGLALIRVADEPKPTEADKPVKKAVKSRKKTI